MKLYVCIFITRTATLPSDTCLNYLIVETFMTHSFIIILSSKIISYPEMRSPFKTKLTFKQSYFINKNKHYGRLRTISSYLSFFI